MVGGLGGPDYRLRGDGVSARVRQRGGARSVGSVIDRVLARLGVDEVVDRYRVFGEWSALLGSDIARAARPQRLDGDVLIVGVASPAWMNELSLRRVEILRSLNAGRTRGKIRKVIFRLDPDIEGVNRPATNHRGPSDPAEGRNA